MELRGEFEVHQIFDLGARMALFVDGHQLLQNKKSRRFNDLVGSSSLLRSSVVPLNRRCWSKKKNAVGRA
jgi:hypothetical protein